MLGERLKAARRMAGLSLRELSPKVGVSAQAISKYERGEDAPSSGVLLRLSRALGVKVEFLLRPTTVKFSPQAYRKHHSLPRKLERSILARVQEWVERYVQIEEIVHPRQRRGRLPEYQVSEPEEVEEAAEKLRRRWQLGFDPIENLVEVLEGEGVKVGLVDAPDRFDAVTFRTDDVGPVIAVNSGVPGDRQRFNLCHELGHLVLKCSGTVSEEKAAHRFAGAFLAPKRAVLPEIGERRRTLSLYELHTLKHKYGLSMQAWIYRAKDLGIISARNAGALFKAFRSRGWKEREPGAQYPREKPRRMERLVFRALEEDIISETRAAELLDISVPDLRRKAAEVIDQCVLQE